ncbi:Rhodanese-like domain protein [Fulvivirga imtechensis AK7]|uniref:Rhodanese-like domain protein n=1 Tax=Fulvivirga imtechensis AK7 TaxID=1237149 RepID=L8JJ15_9BACT|nr:YceI family protein [Fulvivirga imtechensis]ELR68881.1 Rhodanese-like domain protein [Fulvivirga imtechensis AK7]
MNKNLLILTLVSVVSLMSFINLPTAGTYSIDTKASELKWTGYHLAKSYEHWGHVQLKSGALETDGEKITGGTFVIDMNSISNADIEEEKNNQKLVNHLKSDDFFSVKDHPEAKLVIKSSEKTGENTYKTTGDLTIKGITKEIEFGTTVNKLTDTEIEAVADMRVPRTEFKVMYGWKVENAILDGEFRMEVKLVGKK